MFDLGSLGEFPRLQQRISGLQARGWNPPADFGDRIGYLGELSTKYGGREGMRANRQQIMSDWLQKFPNSPGVQRRMGGRQGGFGQGGFMGGNQMPSDVLTRMWR